MTFAWLAYNFDASGNNFFDHGNLLQTALSWAREQDIIMEFEMPAVKRSILFQF